MFIEIKNLTSNSKEINNSDNSKKVDEKLQFKLKGKEVIISLKNDINKKNIDEETQLIVSKVKRKENKCAVCNNYTIKPFTFVIIKNNLQFSDCLICNKCIKENLIIDLNNDNWLKPKINIK